MTATLADPTPQPVTLDELSDEERFIVTAFRELTDAGRQAMWDLLKLAYARQREADG